SFIFYLAHLSPETYTLALHDALPISELLLPILNENLSPGITGLKGKITSSLCSFFPFLFSHMSEIKHLGLNEIIGLKCNQTGWQDRKSTRLNSSHVSISYAVFCLKKK